VTVDMPRPGNSAQADRQRIRRLERQRTGTQQSIPSSWVYWEQLFDYAGGTAPSDKYSPPFTCELVEVFATLRTAGSSSTAAQLLINAGAQETLTIPAASDRALITVRHGLQRRVDNVQFTATLGTGAADLLIHCLFRRRV